MCVVQESVVSVLQLGTEPARLGSASPCSHLLALRCSASFLAPPRLSFLTYKIDLLSSLAKIIKLDRHVDC